MRPAAADHDPSVTGSSARTGIVADFLGMASGISWGEVRRRRRVVCDGLLGPSAKFTTVRFLPIKSLVEKHISVEKSCNVRDNLTSCSLLRRTGAALHHTFRLRCQ